MATEAENKEIVNLNRKVGNIKVWDLHYYMVSQLKEFLEKNRDDSEEIPFNVREQFKLLLEKRIGQEEGTAWQIGRFINHSEYNNWDKVEDIDSISLLKEKIEFVFMNGTINAQATLRGSIEMTNLDTLALPSGEGFKHPCFRAEEALKEKNRKNNERKKKASKKKAVKKKAVKKVKPSN